MWRCFLGTTGSASIQQSIVAFHRGGWSAAPSRAYALARLRPRWATGRYPSRVMERGRLERIQASARGRAQLEDVDETGIGGNRARSWTAALMRRRTCEAVSGIAAPSACRRRTTSSSRKDARFAMPRSDWCVFPDRRAASRPLPARQRSAMSKVAMRPSPRAHSETRSRFRSLRPAAMRTVPVIEGSAPPLTWTFMWAMRVLIPRPLPCEGSALPLS